MMMCVCQKVHVFEVVQYVYLYFKYDVKICIGIKSINLYYFVFEIHFFVFVIKNTEKILTI